MAHDVFISYSNQDKPTADAVCATLEAQGIRCWIAPRDIIPGKEWGEAIVEGITEARVMVVVFSHHSNESRQVMREVERAVNAGIAVLPFRIEEVTPSGSMEYFLSSTHWLDALTDNMEEHILSLAANVQALLGRAEKAPKGREPAAAAAVPKKTRGPTGSSWLSGQLKFVSGAGAAVLALALFFLFVDFGEDKDDSATQGSDEAAAIAVMQAAGIRKLNIEKVGEQDAPAAAVQFSASLAEGDKALTDKLRWTIYDQNNTRVKYVDDIAPKLALLPGEYRLEVERDGVKGATVFESRDNKATAYAVILDAGWMQSRAAIAEGGQPIAGGLVWKVFDDATDPGKPLAQSYDDQPRLLLFEGSYRLTLNKGHAAVEETVEVKRGATVTPVLVLGAGTLVMTATLEEGGDFLSSDLGWQVYPADQPEDKSPVAHTYDAKTSLLVPAGRYRVRVTHHDAQAYVEMVVEAGETTEGNVSLNAGVLRALARLEGKGTQMGGDLSWQLSTPASGTAGKGKRVSHTYEDVTNFVVPAGGYELTLKHGTAQATVPVSVNAGQLTETEVTISVGRLEVSVVDDDGDSDFEKDPSCQVLTRGGGAFGGKPQRVFHFYGVSGGESLASGAYTINCKVADREGSAEVDIRSGEVSAVEIVVP